MRIRELVPLPSPPRAEPRPRHAPEHFLIASLFADRELPTGGLVGRDLQGLRRLRIFLTLVAALFAAATMVVILYG